MKRFAILALLLLFLVGSVPTWAGRKIPCRIDDSSGKDLFIMTLGKVETPIAQGYFDIEKDTVYLKDGRKIPHYYRDKLGIKFYTPIDKTYFPLPPSGWCSWYYYYQEVNAEEVRKNARWIAENLKDYGAVYVQIDDGWQGTGHGLGENRDWTTVNERFLPEGMDGLASYIKSLGLKAGLWLAPHGQSNPEVVRKFKNAFLLKPDGTSASETWEGKFLVDPSTEAGLNYLRQLFRKLKGWGYEYFKIDGQPIVVREYKNKLKYMRNPGDPVALYRKSLMAIREAVGPRTYILGCWGIPLEGIGIMNGSRTGGDVKLGFEGFLVAVEATMKYYFLHNIVWYCDPDVMLLRKPMSIETAKAWATLQGLTGQALMASDRMYELSPERVKILKKVFPAVDIVPFDLFPARKFKPVWDLKVSHLGRNYDVVGLFNFNEREEKGILLKFSSLGYGENELVHVFDFWAGEYLGAWKGGYYAVIPPAGVRVLTLMRVGSVPKLISTSRHITQGWVELKDLRFDHEKLEYEGKSRLIGGDPYILYFAFPPKGQTFKIVSASADGADVRFINYDRWALVEIISKTTKDVSWKVKFAKGDTPYLYPVKAPYRIREVQALDVDKVRITWYPIYFLCAGYNVYLNGKLVGFSPVNEIVIKGLNPEREYEVEVRSVWYDLSESEKSAKTKFKIKDLLPSEVDIASLEPEEATAGWGWVRKNASVSGNPIEMGGKRFATGYGTHANSTIEFKLHGIFTRFKGMVGLDSGSRGKGSIKACIIGDGKKLWDSGLMKGKGAKKFDVEIKGINVLKLKIEDGGDGINYDHADWVGVLIKDEKVSKR